MRRSFSLPQTSQTESSLGPKKKSLRWKNEEDLVNDEHEQQRQTHLFEHLQGGYENDIDNKSDVNLSSEADTISIRTEELMDKWDTGDDSKHVVSHHVMDHHEADDHHHDVEDRSHGSFSANRHGTESTLNISAIQPKTSIDRELISFYNRPSMVNVLQDEKASSTLNDILATSAERPSTDMLAASASSRRPSIMLGFGDFKSKEKQTPPPTTTPPKSTTAEEGLNKQKPEHLDVITVKPVSSHPKFGIVDGVYIPCVSAVLGTILFLKVPWILGNAGLAYSLLYVVISVLCSVFTWNSLSAVVTNGLIRSGGPITIMSRVLGNQFSGSVGIIYFIGFIFLLSLHSFGAATLVLTTVHDFYPGFVIADRDVNNLYWDVIILALGFLVLLFLFVLIGIRVAVKVESIFIVAVGITILLFVIGCFVTVKPQYKIGTASWATFTQNFHPEFDQNVGFFSVMAVIFPTIVGLLAGLNRSGNLKNLSRNIPVGTMAALITTTFVYIAVFILMSFVGDRKMMKEHSSEYFALIAFPDFGLSIGTYIVKAGMLIAILGEGLQALIAAPRILQALANDNVVPFVSSSWFSGNECSEPRRAIVLSSFLAIFPLFLGNLESISTFIAMLLLLCFGFLNLATIIASISPNWRPRWKLFHWSLGLIGLFVCGLFMFLIGWYWALLAFAIGLFFYVIIEVKNETSSYGEALNGLKLQSALNALYSCESYDLSVKHKKKRMKTTTEMDEFERGQLNKNWRPQLLCLVKIMPDNTIVHSDLLNIAFQLKKGRGLCIVAAVIEGDVKRSTFKLAQKEKQALTMKMKEKGIVGFPQILISRTFSDGVKHVIQSSGLGPLTPNTIVFGYPAVKDRTSARHFVEIIKYAEICNKAVIISKGDFNVEEESGFMDLYWIIYEGGLELLVSFLLHRHKAWRNTSLRIFSVVDNRDSVNTIKDHVSEILYYLRIEAECHVLYLEPQENALFASSTTTERSTSTTTPETTSTGHGVSNLNEWTISSASHLPHHSNVPPPPSLTSTFSSSTMNSVSENVEINLSSINAQPQLNRKPKLDDFLLTSSRLNQLIREYSLTSQLVLINLPFPSPRLSHLQYVECLNCLTRDISRVVFIRGCGREVITHWL
ncbi:hypothetical protein C9374_003282 [Naegleria lovaniensis]|uniref:Uncharacterized protein n=1 Tax=Naegleria lovaniensis TaxID=51637 RepID=A0AA88KPI5_NAELO|nr:uncharacterized protein C9374_003282 [Naegleria lovaniensis]KAG2385467.1 hypothetical protein C9374_003282 [Naegleria lovaniensis]